MFGRKKCQLVVRHWGKEHGSFPLSNNGWAAAKKTALRLAKQTNDFVIADLHCNGEKLEVFSCESGRCLVSSHGVMPDRESPVLAGARRRRRRKR